MFGYWRLSEKFRVCPKMMALPHAGRLHASGGERRAGNKRGRKEDGKRKGRLYGGKRRAGRGKGPGKRKGRGKGA